MNQHKNQLQEYMVFKPHLTITVMFVLLYLSQELVTIMGLMLSSTTIDLNNNSKIMIHLQADTTMVGEIIQILSGLITHNNNLIMHHFRTTMLDIVDHMCPTNSTTDATTIGQTDDNAEHAVPARNQCFHSESDHTNGIDGYFTEHINSDKLPSQIMNNPKNVSSIALRLGKQTELPTSTPYFVDDIGKLIHATTPFSSISQQLPPIPLSFPPNIIPNKKMEEVDKEILDTFREVEVNIPLLEAIKQIPRYVKFLNQLCTRKMKLKGNETISMVINALIGKPIPHILEKCKDLGTFTVFCIIGNRKFENVMLDLVASINLINEHISDFIHDSDSSLWIASHTFHVCTDYEMCSAYNDDFLDVTIDLHDIGSYCTNPIAINRF
ncbi:hypothetical protein Lal_00035258 [Lupinus albus]|nr:hypothetical protein Lal_00035258 [Lupinus albus]